MSGRVNRRGGGSGDLRRGSRGAASEGSAATAPPGYLNSFSTVFDGVDETATIGDVAALKFIQTDPFSLSIWFKTTSTANNMTMLGKKLHSGMARPGYQLQLSKIDEIMVEITNTRNTNEILIEYDHVANLFRDGEWHHALFTYDGSTNASGVVLYIDNVVQAPTVVNDNLSASIDGTGSAAIASQNGVNQMFDGNLEEPSIWDKALSVAEVSEVFNTGTPDDLGQHSATANLVGWWRCGDRDPFPTMIDNSTNSNDATMQDMELADFVLDVPP